MQNIGHEEEEEKDRGPEGDCGGADESGDSGTHDDDLRRMSVT